MRKRVWLIIPLLIIAAVFVAIYIAARGHNMALLSPDGTIAHQQKQLILVATGLMLLVLIPVYYLTFSIAWKYHEDNKKPRKYEPNWDHNRLLEVIWWGVPCVIIGILVFITWKSTHSLDPYRPLSSHKDHLNVQVVAMDWKWLFIYPDQDIASVNLLKIPVDTPVSFSITSDAAMNSFWIPELGGQIYAMAGMSTKLHLEADKIGTFRGLSANISGEGFADMTFNTEAVTDEDFSSWVNNTRGSGEPLNEKTYAALAKPSIVKKPILFKDTSDKLYDNIIMKYMMPAGENKENGESHYGHH